MKYLVTRRACLMEDEGRNQPINVFPTKDLAEAAIVEYASSYFYLGDFFITELEE